HEFVQLGEIATNSLINGFLNLLNPLRMLLLLVEFPLGEALMHDCAFGIIHRLIGLDLAMVEFGLPEQVDAGDDQIGSAFDFGIDKMTDDSIGNSASTVPNLLIDSLAQGFVRGVNHDFFLL